MANALSSPADSLTARGLELSSPPPATSTSEELTDRDFVSEFHRRPVTAVDTLLTFSRLGLVSNRAATQWIFPLLVQARGEIRRHLYKALLALEEPKIILDVALAAYEKHGNEDRLTLAASLLMDLGAHAVPALRILVRAHRSECAWFVSTIAGLPGVKLQDRIEMLKYLVKNPHIEVRQSLLGATQALSSAEAISLLHMLSQDPDEEIAEEAREYLAHLEA